MPGNPATTPNLGLPRYDNSTDPANYALQQNAQMDTLDLKVPPLVVPRVAGAANLPSTANARNGMEVDVVVNSGPSVPGQINQDTNHTNVWRFGYSTALPATGARWEYKGGGRELIARSSNTAPPGSSGGTPRTISAVLTIPRAGYWLMDNRLELDVYSNTASGMVSATAQFTTSDGDENYWQVAASGYYGQNTVNVTYASGRRPVVIYCGGGATISAFLGVGASPASAFDLTYRTVLAALPVALI